MRRLVLEYYFTLRTVLRTRPHLKRCLTRCRHCRIFFLTHPRNAGRRDLGCPFGCRKAHRGKASSERSAAYYRTEAGLKKKKELNGTRRPSPSRGGEPEQKSAAVPDETPRFDPTIVEHVRMVVSLIEGRRVGREEVLEMLARTLRQRSMCREKRTDYAVRLLPERPP